MQRLLDPPGSGYRSETGGLMESLRVLTPEQSQSSVFKSLLSTKLHQVRTYHSSYYVPHNLALIVAGTLSEGTSSLLRVVQEQVEPNIVHHKQNKGSHPAGWKRPFVESRSAIRRPVSVTTKEVVEFPEKDESMILVLFL
jgi:Zn-dependent M16 (insulinase) family peptidase